MATMVTMVCFVISTPLPPFSYPDINYDEVSHSAPTKMRCVLACEVVTVDVSRIKKCSCVRLP